LTEQTQKKPDSERWSRLSALFDAALDLPPALREPYVDEQCAGDVDLAQRLRRMLSADADADDHAFLESPLVTPHADAWRDVMPTDYVPGTRRFGAYRLLRLIGQGGMGEVHLAERSDGEFEQRVALKLLPHPTPGLIQRFRQERQILARLEHPNIARLLDGGVGEANVPYFAMEYVDGVPITAFVADAKLDVPGTLATFLQVCEALQYAHRSLVVHRDIKPSNILVGADGVPKLLDFGIAKVLQTTDRNEALQTVARVFTPDYAAPEQIRGDPVTTATDVYSLGVVLYEVLSGARPYKLKRDESLEQAILTVDPVAPSVIAERTTGNPLRARQLRGDVDRIVLTALAKEPERRYASVEALAADIRRFLDGRPIAARGDNTAYRVRKFMRRNRGGISAAGIVVLALILATGVSLWQASRANAEARRAEAEAATANAVQDFMINTFTQAEPWRNAGHPPNALELAESAMDRIDTELAKQPMAKVKMYKALGRLFRVAGDVRMSTAAGARAVKILESIPGVDADSIHDARTGLLFSLIYTGDFDGAEREYAVLAANPAKDETRRLAVEDARALLARDRGRLLEYRQLEAAIEPRTMALYGEDHNRTAQAEYHVYEADFMLGHYAQAQIALEHTYRINAALNTVDAPLRAEGLMNLLVVAAERGAAVAAIDPAAQLVERTRRTFGRSGYLSDSLLRMGRIQRLAGQTADAVATLTEAVDIFADPSQGNVLHRAAGDVELGLACLQAGQTAQADSALRRALSAYQSVGGETDPRVLAVRAALARSASLRHELNALAQLQDLAQQARKQPLAELPEVLDWLAQAQREAGQASAAEAAWTEALQVLDRQGRPLSPTALRAQSSLALLFDATQHPTEAANAARSALAMSLAMSSTLLAAQQPTLQRIANADAADADLIAATRLRAETLSRPGLPTVALAKNDLAAMRGVPVRAATPAVRP
jgi:eukaryotic-like serine/threonine-protein kinase